MNANKLIEALAAEVLANAHLEEDVAYTYGRSAKIRHDNHGFFRCVEFVKEWIENN